jgi:membrane peptidoglycan carboxypeptidase
VSNPDLPGPYWQEQDEAGYRGGRGARPASADRYQPWDDRQARSGGSNGRGDHQAGGARHSRGSGQSNGNGNGRAAANGNGNGRAAANGNGNGRAGANGNGRVAGNGHGSRHAAGWNDAGTGRGATTWTGMMSRGSRNGQRRESRWESRWQDLTDGFSHTADDLRKKLGMRGSGSGRGTQGWPSRSSAYGNGAGGSRTALRQRDDYWGGEDRTRTSSRTATRPGSRTGGPGRGGGGGRGRGGGRWDGRYPGGAGERFRAWLRSGSWWRHWTVKKVLALAGACVAAVILLGVVAFFIVYENTKIPTASDLTANWQSSVVYFADGSQMGTFDSSENGTSVDRILLTSPEIPNVMTQAMTAAEDRHFYTEGGVSLTGLMRAAFEDLFGHGVTQGGSTITMQYAKNYYAGVNTGQNLSTKFKEIIIAMKLGHDRSKSWVMTNYLNTVDFGGTNLGLGAAAENYFDINLTNTGATLTISQAAMLAAMPNAPGFFNPSPSGGAGYTALVARWNYVLDNMVRDGDISQQVRNEQKFPTLTPPVAGNGESGTTGYLMSMVQQQLTAPPADGGYGLTLKQINTGGYKIYTTFQPALVNQLALSIDQQVAVMKTDAADEGMAPMQTYDRIGAVLEDPKTGAILAVYGGPGYSSGCTDDCWINMAESPQPVGSSFKPYVLATAVNEGMNVFTSQLNGYSPIWIPESPANETTTEDTLSPTSPPTGVSAQANGGYSGGLYYFKFDEDNENSNSPLPVNVAAAISSDPAFEDLAHRDGIQNVINMAQTLGVGTNAFVQPCSVAASQSPNATQAQIIAACNDMTGPVNGLNTNFGEHSTKDTAGSPALALGENPLTPVEQASTFATLADDGLYHTPHVIGQLVQNNNTVKANIATTQVLSQAAAADIDYALSFDNQMADGTAFDNVPFRRGDVIGKTGTLGVDEVASQAWFNGSTPDQDALSVALFTNDPASENLDDLPSINGMPGSQGGGWPADIWNAFMTTEFSNEQAVPLFPTTNGAPFVTWIQATTKKQCTLQQFMQGQSGQQCTCPKHGANCGFGNNPGNNNGLPSPGPTTSPCTGFHGGGQCPPTTPATNASILIGGGSSGASSGSPPLLAADEATAVRLTKARLPAVT